MNIDKFTRISKARRRFMDLYDHMFDARDVAEEDAFFAELFLAAGEVWTLMTGSRDMPDYIEYCLPSWHKNYVDIFGKSKEK